MKKQKTYKGFGCWDFLSSEPLSQYSAQHVIVFTSLSLSFHLNLGLILHLSLSNRANIHSILLLLFYEQ